MVPLGHSTRLRQDVIAHFVFIFQHVDQYEWMDDLWSEELALAVNVDFCNLTSNM